MIKQILDCLKLDFKHDSELISIAKGKNKLPETFKEAFKQAKEILNGTRSRG
jgi:hypothetical protein